MPGNRYEFLSAQDASFLAFEERHTHMHLGAIALLESAPLTTASGGLDIDRIRRHVGARLELLPRYRQRLDSTPLQRRPIWVDDARFELRYHVRHTALPLPGGEAGLKELAGRLLSQQLDRHKPLWELWVVEGLEGGRCALLFKVHHCMTDGVSGLGLLTSLLSPSASDEPAQAAPWVPRPPPGAFELLLDEGLRGAAAPLLALRALGRAARRGRETSDALVRTAGAVAQAVRAGFRVVPATPLNQPIGPHRSVDWHTLDLDAVRQLKKELDGTLNDVVLCVVAGALRRFLARRRFDPRGLDYRVVVPVNMRDAEADASAGNRVSAWLLSLPIAEQDPRERHPRVRAETERLRRSGAALGTDLLIRFADWTGSRWFVDAGTHLTARLHPYHMIVTNVAGPQFPLFLLGARLEAVVPQLPLFEHQGLAVAVMSYLGKLSLGLVADADLVPDLGAFAGDLEASFGELRDAARSGDRLGRGH